MVNGGGDSFFPDRLHGVQEITTVKYPSVKRRDNLPEPKEKEKPIGLWSIIKDNIGKDLSGVCLPVYFNEPLSSLQKCFEDLERGPRNHNKRHGCRHDMCPRWRCIIPLESVREAS